MVHFKNAIGFHMVFLIVFGNIFVCTRIYIYIYENLRLLKKIYLYAMYTKKNLLPRISVKNNFVYSRSFFVAFKFKTITKKTSMLCRGDCTPRQTVHSSLICHSCQRICMPTGSVLILLIDVIVL